MLYKESNYKKFIIVLFLITTLLLMLKFYKYNEIYYQKGYVKDGNIEIYVKSDFISKIYNKPIKFLSKNIDYKVIDISENLYENASFYKIITISSDIDSIYLKKNNVLDLEIIIGETDIISKIYQKIMKGMGI